MTDTFVYKVMDEDGLYRKTLIIWGGGGVKGL